MEVNRKLIFLDFDGVLHPFFPSPDLSDEENQRFSYLPRLEAILRDYPEWQIVISSTWRRHRDLDTLRQLFSSDIADRIVGVTPVLSSMDGNAPVRYQEIKAFLGDDRAQWIALDDDDTLFPKICEHLIVCFDGIRDREEALIRDRLRVN